MVKTRSRLSDILEDLRTTAARRCRGGGPTRRPRWLRDYDDDDDDDDSHIGKAAVTAVIYGWVSVR